MACQGCEDKEGGCRCEVLEKRLAQITQFVQDQERDHQRRIADLHRAIAVISSELIA